MEVERGQIEKAVAPPTPQTSVYGNSSLLDTRHSSNSVVFDHIIEKDCPQEKHVPEVKEGEDNKEKPNSPTNSQKTISDDEEIDYSIKPEFYDPTLDDKDELWVQKGRKGQYSDAVLSCPACFTTLCLECQRHEKYVTQYRAIFVVNCKNKVGDVSQLGSLKRKRSRRGKALAANDATGESFIGVCCAVCSTEVGVIDEEEVYHFFNVLPSEC